MRSKIVDVEGNDDVWLCGGKYGYGIMDKRTGKGDYIKRFWSDNEVASGKPETFQSNDGAVDKRGRFFLCTISDPLSLHRTDGEHLLPQANTFPGS